MAIIYFFNIKNVCIVKFNQAFFLIFWIKKAKLHSTPKHGNIKDTQLNPNVKDQMNVCTQSFLSLQ